MFEYDKFKSFLVCIDVFSRKLFAVCLKQITAKAVQQALDKIFRQAKVVPEKLEVDRVTLFFYVLKMLIIIFFRGLNLWVQLNILKKKEYILILK
jgi:hypothetical protein